MPSDAASSMTAAPWSAPSPANRVTASRASSSASARTPSSPVAQYSSRFRRTAEIAPCPSAAHPPPYLACFPRGLSGDLPEHNAEHIVGEAHRDDVLLIGRALQ